MQIAPLQIEDRPAWETPARGYKTFYRTELPAAAYELAWKRLLDAGRVHGIGAWAFTIGYLQDLFVAPELRVKGVARALIGGPAAR